MEFCPTATREKFCGRATVRLVTGSVTAMLRVGYAVAKTLKFDGEMRDRVGLGRWFV